MSTTSYTHAFSAGQKIDLAAPDPLATIPDEDVARNDEDKTGDRVELLNDMDKSNRSDAAGAGTKKLNSSKSSLLADPIENPDLHPDNNDDQEESLWRDIREFRIKCGRIVNDDRVQLLIVVLIGINAIMMGIGTFDFVTENEDVYDTFKLIDTIFLSIFTVELALQMIYLSWRLFLDGWLFFDFVIILVSWSFDSVQIIRAFRIFRALRLITRIKIMKDLVVAIFGVLPKMAAISLLLFLVSYIFAVMMTQLFNDLYDKGLTSQNYFGRLDNTFFTLFQIMTLDAWADIAREVMEVQKHAWIPFIAFVTISGFVIVNLMIAVICDAVANLDSEDAAALYGGGDNPRSTNAEDLHEQMESLESKVSELVKMQAQTMDTMKCLNSYLNSKGTRFPPPAPSSARAAFAASKRSSAPSVVSTGSPKIAGSPKTAPAARTKRVIMSGAVESFDGGRRAVLDERKAAAASPMIDDDDDESY